MRLRNEKGIVMLTFLIILPLALSVLSLIRIRLVQNRISAQILIECAESAAESLDDSNFDLNKARTVLDLKIEALVKKYADFFKATKSKFTYQIGNPTFEYAGPLDSQRNLVFDVKLEWQRHFSCGARALRQGDTNTWVYKMIADRY